MKNQVISPNENVRIDHTVKIVICGGSGFGKTTLAKALGEKHGYLTIEADKLRFLALKEDPRVAMQVFGEAPQSGEDAMIYAFRAYEKIAELGVDALAKADYLFFKLTKPHVDKYISEISTCVATKKAIAGKFISTVLYQPEQEVAKSGLVMDGIFTNDSEYLGRETDAIAFIRTNQKQRDEMLAKRLVQGDGLPPELVGTIIKARNISYDNLSKLTKQFGLKLKNDYDDDSLQDNADSINYTLEKLEQIKIKNQTIKAKDRLI